MKTQKLCNICWFTSLKVKNKPYLKLTKPYSIEYYPKYDNYDAINIDKVKHIPCDWKGTMGCPITFLDKWNPNQFEILGDSRYITGEANDINVINGKLLYRRILIKNKKI
jgi:hypothetical protein